MGTVSKMEMEVGSALRIAQSMAQTISDLEKFWPKSARGSNAQRVLDDLKAKRDTLELCLRDATKEGQ